MNTQALEQVTWGHKCSLTSSVCVQQLGFCFGSHEWIVVPFSSPTRTWPSTDVEGERQSHGVDRAPLTACRTDLLSVPSPGQQRQVNTGFILVALLYFRRQLSLLHTSSPSSQGVVTQPSKYQNMLWFETWCTESQAPEWLWFASKFKKILSFVGYLFTVFTYVWRVF